MVACDWDESNVEHIARHGIQPAEVAEILANEAVDLGYEFVNGEDRWTSIGHTSALRILVVVWTLRGELVRPVTAFEAGRKLAEEYRRQRGWSIMAVMKSGTEIPEFESEAQEAAWWDDHKEMAEENLLNAMRDGTAGKGTAQRLIKEARLSKNITIRMPLADLERARRLSEKKGLGYQTFMKMLLHEALEREDQRLEREDQRLAG